MEIVIFEKMRFYMPDGLLASARADLNAVGVTVLHGKALL
jgi:hypothetical protein